MCRFADVPDGHVAMAAIRNPGMPGPCLKQWRVVKLSMEQGTYTPHSGLFVRSKQLELSLCGRGSTYVRPATLNYGRIAQ